MFAFKNILLIVAFISHVLAHEENDSLKAMIRQSLESRVNAESEMEGVQNCPNKCSKVFDRTAYQINTLGGNTFEFQACVIGCNTCSADMSGRQVDAKHCFEACKNRDWGSQQIVKGVLEPDKACMAGCIIQTCQVICSSGTPLPFTPATQNLYWNFGGCSVKTAPYSQQSDYVPFDSPNTSQGGAEVAACCANAMSLCQYVGDKNTLNYQNLVKVASRSCNLPTVPSICSFFRNQANCGTTSQA